MFRVLHILCVVFYFLLCRNWLFIWLKSCFSSWSLRRCYSWTLLLRCWVCILIVFRGVLCWVFWWYFWVYFFIVNVIFYFWYFTVVSFNRYFWVFVFLVMTGCYVGIGVRFCFNRGFWVSLYRSGTFRWVWVWGVMILAGIEWLIVGVGFSLLVIRAAMIIILLMWWWYLIFVCGVVNMNVVHINYVPDFLSITLLCLFIFIFLIYLHQYFN